PFTIPSFARPGRQLYCYDVVAGHAASQHLALAELHRNLGSGMANVKPTASISLDLDNKWAYMRTHGDTGWDSYPSYLGQVVPLALQTLAAQELKATIFLVGRDAQEPANRELLAQIPQQGHEVGNHSQNHLQWMHRLPRAELEREVADAEDAIE